MPGTMNIKKTKWLSYHCECYRNVSEAFLLIILLNWSGVMGKTKLTA